MMAGRRWLVVWTAGAVSTATGVVLLYLGPFLFPVGKALAPGPLPAQAPLALLAAGALAIVAGSVGLMRTRGRPTTAHHAADLAATAGAIVAGAALLLEILFQVGWPIVASTMRGGPCDSNPVPACFQAHPDYYQEMTPGDYSTPVSRLGGVVGPIELGMWPVAFAAGTTCVAALALGTRRRRVAAFGVFLGSIPVVGMVLEYLAFLAGGGD